MDENKDLNGEPTGDVTDPGHPDVSETFGKNENKYEKICYMCHRTERDAGPLFNMPGGMCLCRDCMQKAFDTIGNNGVDFSKLQGISFANLNLADLPNLTSMEIPCEKQVKKRTEKPAAPAFTMKDIPAPHILKAKLDDYVVGQEQAKKVMSVAVYNHYKRLYFEGQKKAEKPESGSVPDDGVTIEKSNILMIGPTGSGKTYLVKTLAKLLNVPLAITDATSLTESGYIGDDIESVISKLLSAAGNDVDKAECGIVFIDEIDKLAKKKETTSRDISGEGVQQELLKLLEGSRVEVPVGSNQKNALSPMTTVNTENILFICGGAFPDLAEIIKERLNRTSGVGFNSELKDRYDSDPDILSHVTNEDLRKFGMIPEFLGRLPITVTLQSLNRDFLAEILRKPKNAILKQYEKLLAMDEVKLEFDDDAIMWIADEAMKKDTGARALRSIMEEFMLDIMYEIPKDRNIGTVIITRDYLEKTGGPKIIMRGE